MVLSQLLADVSKKSHRQSQPDVHHGKSGILRQSKVPFWETPSLPPHLIRLQQRVEVAVKLGHAFCREVALHNPGMPILEYSRLTRTKTCTLVATSWQDPALYIFKSLEKKAPLGVLTSRRLP